jgi:hypothetical protein
MLSRRSITKCDRSGAVRPYFKVTHYRIVHENKHRTSTPKCQAPSPQSTFSASNSPYPSQGPLPTPMADGRYASYRKVMATKRSAPDLHALLEQVRDEPTFVAFLKALGNDFALEQELEAEHPVAPYGSGRLGWENGTVDAFLDAAAAWSDETAQRSPPAETSPWQRCAQIPYAGKFYE